MLCCAPNTNNPLRTRPNYVKPSPCPKEISPQLKQTVWMLILPIVASLNRSQINIKSVDPKPFDSNTMQARMWLSTLKCYFIVVGLIYTATEAADTEAACQYTVVLMAGNIARWMDKLEVQGHAPSSFLEFKKLFIY